ncbi:MAG TPA: histidine kinase, partial [Bacteroidia bacterium]|nr:histidine kinase [Bacteroidia bacterium]
GLGNKSESHPKSPVLSPKSRFMSTETSRRELYWWCQLGGWMLYVLLNAFYLYVQGQFNGNIAFLLTFIFLSGIILTQILRWVIIHFNWLNLSIPKFLPLVLGMNILMAAPIALLQSGLNPANWIQLTIQFTFLFLFWSMIYYLVHYIQNYKKAEIENLKWQSAIHETELNKLKSQLNPHFMFNAMNSIRALVGENPAHAKEAITKLSNLLRNTLQMGKQKLIPLAQELEAVKDYLAIESIRFEERLKIDWKISPETESMEVPPLMIQTLVENGIKHGIAKLPEGGMLAVETMKSDDGLTIIIRNSGQYDSAKIPESGFGLRNSFERLELLYNSRAKISIENEDSKTVITKLFIPGQTKPAIS